MTSFILAILLLFSSLNLAHAQDDYFPPAGIYIPCCYGSGTGHTGATYGRNGSSAWRQVWGAQPGDVVTFQFVLRTASAGSLHAWPKAANWIDPEYLGDPNNPYQKWYWNTGERESGGTFCLDCLWRFTVPPGYYNPWIWIDYWDSGDGWDVDLNVVNIQTPSPLSSFFKMFTDPTKDQAGGLSAMFATMFGFFTGASAGFVSDPPLSATLGIAAVLTDKASGHYDQLRRDPPNYDYCTTAEFNMRYDLDYGYWADLSGGWLVYSGNVILALFDQAQEAVDKATTAAQNNNVDCAYARRGEAISALNTMGWYWYAFRYSLESNINAYPYDLSSVAETYWQLEEAANWSGGVQ